MGYRNMRFAVCCTASAIAISICAAGTAGAQTTSDSTRNSPAKQTKQAAKKNAQAQQANQTEENSASVDSQHQNAIIVTGVANASRKIDTTFTINTLTQKQIQQLAPISTADLLNNIPGFFAEGSTAGERSNNVTVRGLPSSGYRYAPQLVDGMPAFQDSDVPFANDDVFFTPDLMTDRVEAIKGGPGGILYSNGLGGVVNYITKTGGDKFAGGYKLELANYGFIRNDLFLSGPITDNLHFAVGGFFRTSDGLRDVGYTADRGGQVRGNLTWHSDDGSTNVELEGAFLNDRTAVYNNLPIEVPGFNTPGTITHPIYINQSTVKPIGINFQNGTLLSPSNRYVTQIGDNGQVMTADLADGIHPVFTTLGAKLDKDFGGGWSVHFKGNYVHGTAGFNALFAGNDAATAANFMNDRYINDFLQPAFDANWQAASGTPLNSPFYNRNVLAYYFNALSPTDFQNDYINPILASGFSNFTTLRAQYGNLQTIAGPGGHLAGFNVSNGQPIPANSDLSFEIPWIVHSKLQSSTQDLQVQKDFNFLGDHHLTFGGYHSNDSDDYNFQAALTISTLASPAELVNVYLVDANGNKIAPLSLNGSYLPGFYGNAAKGDAENYAAYALDHWELFDHRLKIDAGFRWETEHMSMRYQNRVCCSVFFPGNESAGNRAYTQIQTLGDPQYLNSKYYGHGWSVGANYSFTHNFAVYGLASRLFRLPSINDGVAFAQTAPLASPVEHITQFEGGARYVSSVFDVSAAGFYNKFTPRTLINTYQDIHSPACTAGGTVATPATIAQCPLVYQPYSYGSTNYGTEIQATVRPPFIPGFDVSADVTLQNPKVNGSSYTVVNQVGTGPNATYQYVTISQNGRREARQAASRIFIRPRWDLKPLFNIPVKLYASYEHESSRYSTSQDVNVTVYPAYYILDAGALWDITDHLSVQLHVANLTNQLSFTEGDPLFFDLKAPDGTGNRGVARPLFGRTERLMINYRF